MQTFERSKATPEAEKIKESHKCKEHSDKALGDK